MRHNLTKILALLLAAGLGGAALTACDRHQSGQPGEKLSSAADTQQQMQIPGPPGATTPSDGQAQSQSPAGPSGSKQQPPERGSQPSPAGGGAANY